jgi:uracil phosphoribosyltransferase
LVLGRLRLLRGSAIVDDPMRAIGPGLIEVVRVLHEHMEPSRHVGLASE